MNSRRCNLRIRSRPAAPQPRKGLTVAIVRPRQGPGIIQWASPSVGFTYGYSRCPASRDLARLKPRPAGCETFSTQGWPWANLLHHYQGCPPRPEFVTDLRVTTLARQGVNPA